MSNGAQTPKNRLSVLARQDKVLAEYEAKQADMRRLIAELDAAAQELANLGRKLRFEVTNPKT